jgi:ABC-2 type transport system permease protein
MLNLIIKDVVLQKRTILIGFIYVAVMALAFSNGGAAMFTASTFAVAYLLIQTPCAHDDKSRAEAMLLSLPIRRNTIVAAKYASVLLWALIAVFEYVVLYYAVLLSGLPFRMPPVSADNALSLAAAITVFVSIFYPIFFKFGYMKTRYVNIILFAGLFASGSILVYVLGGEGGWQGGKDFAAAIAGQPGWLVACGLLGVLLGAALVSYLLSLRFYSRREF